MIAANLDILMFAALCGGILIGYPVLFTLAGIAVAFALLGTALGAYTIWVLMRDESVPLFPSQAQSSS